MRSLTKVIPLVALVAAGCAESPTERITAVLDLQIVGLPDAASAGVTVNGPSFYSVDGSVVLEPLAGPYTITVPNVQHAGLTWYPNMSVQPLVLLTGEVVTLKVRYGRLPVAGGYVPSLERFDSVMVAFMTERSIGAGTLAVTRQGQLVYRRAFGWKDSARTEPLTPHALMRLASNTKPVTAAAVRRLVSQGAFSYSTKAFAYLGISPSGAVTDQRIHDITIQHLLDHTGGWNAAIAGDVMFRSREVSLALGLTTPPTTAQIASWVMTRPLQHTPGTATAYSNFGYALLGLIVEKATGQRFVDHVTQQLFSGSAAAEVVEGRTLAAQRDTRETFYADPSKGCSVFVVESCVLVPWPNGGWSLEALGAGGGLVASAPAMAAFLDGYWINGQPRMAGAAASFTFFGSLDGTFTMMRQLPDGTNIVALFNQRTDPSGLPYESIDQALSSGAASLGRAPR
jgi:CubicO group peptidase (beta-lactamase class C family)